MADQWYSKEFDGDTGMTHTNFEMVQSYNSFIEGRDPLCKFAVGLREERKQNDDNKEDLGPGKATKVTFYITPEGVKFAEKVDAKACEKPNQKDGWPDYFAGDKDLFGLHFPTGKSW